MRFNDNWITTTCLWCGDPFEYRLGRHERRYCSYACRNRARTLPPDMRFRQFVDPTRACGAWIGAVQNNGYGYFTTWRDSRWRHALAHRFAYELLHGPIPEGF